MGSLLAFPLASALGGVQVTDVRATPLSRRQWLIEWTKNALPLKSTYAIAIDGKHYTNVSDREFEIVQGEFNGSPIVEVIQLPLEYGDPGYFTTGYFETPQVNKIKVSFNPPASVADVEKYRIYWDNATGTVQFTEAFRIGEVFETGLSSYEFWTDQLAADTYKFVVRAVDKFGNEETNTTTITQVITTYPGIVTGQAATFDGGTGKATLTWTDPSDIGSGVVRMYDNAGVTARPYPDFNTIVASVAAGTQTFLTAVLGDGLWVFGHRVFTTIEEPNTSVLSTVRVDTGAEIALYPPKPILIAAVSTGGKIKLRASVDPDLGLGTAVKVKFFTNDGAGGAIDFDTALGPGFVNLGGAGTLRVAELETIAFGETARKFSAQAFTTAGVVSVNADEVTITPDSTAPPAPLGVSTVTGRN